MSACGFLTTGRTTGFNRTFSRLSFPSASTSVGSSRVSRTLHHAIWGGLCASTGSADSNERREGTGSRKSAVRSTALNVCQPQTKG